MILHVEHLSLLVDPLVRMRAEAIHVSEPVGRASITEEDGHLVQGLGTQTPEVPCHVGALHVGLGVSLLAVDEVGELDGVLDEEDWSIVPDHVVISFLRVEFNGKSSGVSVGIWGTLLASYGGESDEERSLLADLVQEFCFREPIGK